MIEGSQLKGEEGRKIEKEAWREENEGRTVGVGVGWWYGKVETDGGRGGGGRKRKGTVGGSGVEGEMGVGVGVGRWTRMLAPPIAQLAWRLGGGGGGENI